MNMNRKAFPPQPLHTSGSIAVFAAVLLALSSAAVLTASAAGPDPAAHPAERVFELMIYHTLPGKAPALEAVFRRCAPLQAQHHLDVIGYWAPDDDPAWTNTFVYLIAHPDRASADAHWHALHSDPAFQSCRNAAAPLIEKLNDDYRVDEIYMRPADFSAMR
jgi:hypothetical protein